MLTYCMNVHPGESLDEQIRNIETLAPRVFAGSAPPHWLGLRFSAAAAAEFVESREKRELAKRILMEKGLSPFTMNAFPYGRFHGVAVKEEVYRPTWSEQERVAYTINAGRVLAELMPEGVVRGSVSTSPLYYKLRSCGIVELRNWVVALEAYKRIHDETGKHLVLSIEPEPGCYPETTEETIEVINAIRNVAAAELHPYLGVCFDTAHLAVEFEDLAESVRRYTSEEITIGKVQLSAALECDDTTEARRELARYAEGVYLHQTANNLHDYFGDLPEYLKSPLHTGVLIRSHFHIPLCETPEGMLRSTARLLWDLDFRAALVEAGCEQFEVETYTWDVWRECSGSAEDVCAGIARELAVCKEFYG